MEETETLVAGACLEVPLSSVTLVRRGSQTFVSVADAALRS
jgi:hypothetical protein